jgi:hypothetical protein
MRSLGPPLDQRAYLLLVAQVIPPLVVVPHVR